MRIAIATPLYPPDTAPAAHYAKELAERLSHTHSVCVVAYSYLPEPIEGVRIVSVTKRLPLLLRLITYTASLFKAAQGSDVVYVINGASVELPLIVVSYITRTPFVYISADTTAALRAGQSKALHFLQTKSVQRSRMHVTSLPLARPEILPLEAPPTDALAAYESSWEAHLALVTHTYGK